MGSLVQISSISVNQQVTCPNRIEEFVELLDAGKPLPPITIRWNGDSYAIVDGRHRLQAHKLIGRLVIMARITL